MHLQTLLGEIVSIQVGQPATYVRDGARGDEGDGDQMWTTAFFKRPIAGAVRVGSLGLAGDAQADLLNHGGVDKAVLAYSAEHYPLWRQHLNLPDLPHGGFGENLTVAGLDEQSVCLGDTWRAGDVLLQVTQPRQPCWKLSRRWGIDDLARQVIANGKSGWYLRVLSEGTLSPGVRLDLVGRPHPAWTVARASDAMHHRKRDLAVAAELASLPELSSSWRTALTQRIARRAV